MRGRHGGWRSRLTARTTRAACFAGRHRRPLSTSAARSRLAPNGAGTPAYVSLYLRPAAESGQPCAALPGLHRSAWAALSSLGERTCVALVCTHSQHRHANPVCLAFCVSKCAASHLPAGHPPPLSAAFFIWFVVGMAAMAFLVLTVVFHKRIFAPIPVSPGSCGGAGGAPLWAAQPFPIQSPLHTGARRANAPVWLLLHRSCTRRAKAAYSPARCLPSLCIGSGTTRA